MAEYDISAVELLNKIGTALAEDEIETIPTTTSVDEADGDENVAELRVGWGGHDLFDIIVKRV